MKKIVLTTTASCIAIALGAPAAVHAQNTEASSENTVSEARTLDTVVVTANRREENIQTTSTAVSAFSGDDLRDKTIQSVEDVATLVPGLQISNYQGDTSIFIRGIGTPVIIAGNDSSTATYIDGVYTSRAAAISPAFFDVERIEVLRGPQGTLYGRNATGGSVNIITKGPSEEFEAETSLVLGNYDRVKVFGAVGGPLSDKVRARIAGQWEDRSGYTTVNLPRGDLPPTQANPSFDAEDKSDFALRASIEADLSENLMLSLTGDYYYADDKSKVFHFASNGYGDEIPGWYGTREGSQTLAYFAIRDSGRSTNTPSRDIYSAVPFFNKTEVFGVTGQIDWQVGEYDVQFIANYKDTNPNHQNQFDLGDTLNTYYQREEDHQQFSGDFQISSPQDKRFSWIVGGGYFDEENDITNDIYGNFWEAILVPGLENLQDLGVIPTFPVIIPETDLCCELHLNGSQETQAFNFYIDTSYQLTDNLTLKVGGRYSEEERDGFQNFDLVYLPATAGGEEVRFAPNIALFPDAISDSRDGVVPDPFGFVIAPVNGPTTFDAFTPKFALEWTAAENIFVYGSVQKGFKSGGYNIGSSQRDPFEPEEIWAYEVGMKATTWQERVRLNLSAFHYDYENLQAQDSIANQPIIRNVGKAEIDGLEVEFAALLSDNFSIDGAVTFLDATYTEGELTEPLLPAPAADPAGSVVTDLAGNNLTRAPELKYNVGAQFMTDSFNGGEFTARVDYSWQDQIYFTVFNLNAASQDSYGTLKARATYRTADEKYSVSLFGDNLTDEEYFTNQILTGTTYGAQFVGNLGAPQTFGIELTATY
ncbi:MAG: TonB-dependent receptor [Henriciella sp.]